MEAIGSSLMLFLIIIGFILLLRKSKLLGLSLISVAFLILIIVPWISFQRYKINVRGVYLSDHGNRIEINDDDMYTIISNEKIIGQGEVKYSNIDLYSFYFEPSSQYRSSTHSADIEVENSTIIYRRIHETN